MPNTNIKYSFKPFKLGATLVLLLLCVSTFSACGKKGTLYLPLDPEPVIEAEAVDKEKTESKNSSNKPAE